MNKSNDFRGHIAEIEKTLQISEEDFRLVNLYKYEDISVSVMNKSTTLGNKCLDCSWWNNFRESRAFADLNYPLRTLEQLIPPKEKDLIKSNYMRNGTRN